ncbi:MAG: exo-alpha-sialidase [Candidatus Hydrogenedentes bacterium]|nr:exo-alpha-sialidase [Candidatus Hydrogenedentota bacterium]
MRRRSFLKNVGGVAATVAGAQIAQERTPAEPGATAAAECPAGPFAARAERRGPLSIKVGPIRVVMRGPMFPGLARFADGSIMVFAQAVEEGGPLTAIRSEDGGDSWKACDAGVDGLGLNTLQLNGGPALSTHYDTKPIDGEPGWRSTRRWESGDSWRTLHGPLEDGRLFLPPEEFDAGEWQWFHGNTLEMPDGHLLAAMQGIYAPSRFRTFIAKSTDRGRTWRFLAHVASLETLDDPERAATRAGWCLWGPCEPSIAHLGGGALICVMRLVNDDHQPLLAEPRETYRDLSYTVPGDGIHPGTLPADRYYEPGPSSAPIVLSFSHDAGATWTAARPMRQARGCFPRLAWSSGVLALTYGGLAYPRWGNCIGFSTDGGKTWCDEINFGPFLTTGYTDVLAVGPKRFLVVFDCAPPQPWKNHAAHWIGAVDIEVG